MSNSSLTLCESQISEHRIFKQVMGGFKIWKRIIDSSELHHQL